MFHAPRPNPFVFPRLIALLAAGVLMSACASRPDHWSSQVQEQQIAEAQRAGTLTQLYAQWSDEAEKLKNTDAADPARTRQAALGSLMAEQAAESLRIRLKAARLKDSGLVPLAEFTELDAKAAQLRDWDSARYETLTRELASERMRSQAALDALKNTLITLFESELQSRYRLLSDAAALAGTASEDGKAFLLRREQALQGAYQKGKQALEAQRFEEAHLQFSRIAEVAPAFADAKRQADYALIRQFQHLVANQRDDTGMDQAMRLYYTLSQRADFAQLKPELESSVVAMLRVLVAEGRTANAADKPAESYLWLKRAQDLRRMSGAPPYYGEEEQHFAGRAFALAELAHKRNQPGLALGYLFAAHDIYPELPSLKRRLRETLDQTLDRATKKVAAASFTDMAEGSRLGRAVASKITQHLFRDLPDDLRIVERDQLPAVMREQEFQDRPKPANGSAPALGLTSADYLIQGTILEAGVATSAQQGRKVIRVATRQQQVPNPEYQAWKKADRPERAAPPEFLKEPVNEDIPLNITLHRKVGVLGISYRIVDVATARILFTDTLTRKKTESGESSDGVQLGDFNSTLKIAQLPSDSEIMEALADDVAGQVGKQLATFLRDHETRYEAAAKRYFNEGNPGAAADELANAWALYRKKGKNVPALGRELRKMALLARPV